MPIDALQPPQGWLLSSTPRIIPPPAQQRGIAFRLMSRLAKRFGRAEIPDIFVVFNFNARLFWPWLFFASRLMPFGRLKGRERELIMVRSRDVLEHIERVVHHVRRLEQNAETAVQMHFSVQSHRANDIMRVLTVLTAIFLPLNLIAGIFGMNFEFIPLVHKADGFWIAMGSMGFIAVALVLVFWRKRYLARTAR